MVTEPLCDARKKKKKKKVYKLVAKMYRLQYKALEYSQKKLPKAL